MISFSSLTAHVETIQRRLECSENVKGWQQAAQMRATEIKQKKWIFCSSYQAILEVGD
jgi:hypothetical protein